LRLTMRRSRLHFPLLACARTAIKRSPRETRETRVVRPLASERGFTLVEVLVAILLLSVGVLGIAKMAAQASLVTGDTKAREGATNLAREVVENVISLPYASVTPDAITGTLQAKPALAPAAGYTSWTVLRRSIAYSLSVTECYVDDPSDGKGAHDATFCSGSTAGVADSRPIDFKRVSVTVTWTRKGITRSVTQTTLLAPKGTNEVPDVTSLTSTSGATITDSSITSVSFSAATSSSASGVAWLVNEGVRGLASGSGKSWSFSWNISGLPDGQYVIGAKAYNSAGTYGTPISLTITLNRAPPSAPQGFVAGWNKNSATVETEWLASPELDTVGYTVYRQQTAPSTGAVTKVNCGTVAAPVYINPDTDCSDASPIIPSSGGGTTTFRAASSNTNGTTSTSSLSINKPSGVAVNDVLVATIAVQGAPTSGTLPAGWSVIRSSTYSNQVQLTSLYHVAGSSEPSSYTFSTGGTKYFMSGGISAYSGVDTSAPVDISNAKTGSSGNAVSLSLTTNYPNDRLINAVAFGGSPSGSTATPDASLTERYDTYAKNLLHESADRTQATAGSTGIKTANGGTNTGWVSQLIALKPSGTATTSISVNYWVVAVDRNSVGAYREGAASNVVNAYAPNTAPNPITSALTCTTNVDGSVTLDWTQPSAPGDPDSGDKIAFDRIYRDEARFDRTGLGTEHGFTDPNPDGVHSYYVTTVDTHLTESAPTGSVSC
jgi:type IV pilus modification protein PilV